MNQSTQQRGFNLVDKYTDPNYDYSSFSYNEKRLSFDSIINTVALGLALVIGSGIIAVMIAIQNPSLGAILSIGSFIALAVMWATMFFKKQIKRPKLLFIAFCVLEGFLLGVLTGTIGNTHFGTTPGWTIIGQAVLGTVSILVICLFLYKQNIIRFAENSKARKVLYTVIAGFGVLYLVNFIITLITGNNMLWGNGILPIIIAVIALIVASLSIIDDFGSIHRHVEKGAQEKEKWLLSLSILSGLLWVYVELLRLLTSLASRN